MHNMDSDSIRRITVAVGIIVIISAVSYFVILTSQYIAQKKRMSIDDKAAERIMIPPTGTFLPEN